MKTQNAVMSKLQLVPGMSPNRAIQSVREFLDNQPDSLQAANRIMSAFDLKPETNKRKAYVFAMAAIENAVKQESLDPKDIMDRANVSIDRIVRSMGPGALEMPIEVQVTPNGKPRSKKGSKRAVAKQLYLENRDKGDKVVIDLIAKALDVTVQNAYTYVYLVKKELTK